MTSADLCQTLNAAFAGVDPSVHFKFFLEGESLAVEVRVYEAPGALYGAVEGPLGLEVEDPARLAAYAKAAAAALRETLPADPDERLRTLLPADLLLSTVLDDPSLRSVEDFAALLADNERLDRARRLREVQGLLGRRAEVEDRLLALLYPLTLDGRATLPWEETAGALQGLLAAGEPGLVVDAMASWVEEYDPFDEVWEGGPSGSTLLLLGAWRALDTRISGPLRRRALDAVDRIADEDRARIGDEVLARAGLG